MPFFASGDIDSFDAMMKTPFGMVRDVDYFDKVKDVLALTQTEAISINKQDNIVSCRDLKSNNNFDLEYDYLLLATGASPKPAKFPVPESDNISFFHNPLDAKKFRQKAQLGKIDSALIIGAGYIGCELAEAMVCLWGIETHLVELTNRLLPQSLDKEISMILEKTLKDNGINLMLQSQVTEITLNDDNKPVTHFADGSSITTDQVFLCLGVNPNTQLARDIDINIGPTNAISVNEHMQSSIDNIWAAGDCAEINNIISSSPCLLPLGSLANKQGRVVADSMAGRESFFPGACGTVSMKVFDMIIAASGLNMKSAEALGYQAAEVEGSWYDRPDYMQDRQNTSAKLIYDKHTYKILGMQIAGKGEVTRYIDAFSVIASFSGSVYDLMDFEHAYTPPHSGPINPLNYLAYMAVNQDSDNIHALSVRDYNTYEATIIDVREADEVAAIPLDKFSLQIPLKEFRSSISEFDKSKKYLIVCQKGPRSYELARFMINSGFDNVAYLAGGVQLLSAQL